MILMRAGRTAKKQSVWERTRYQHLFRYVPSGTIFAWFKIAGKPVRRSLKTTNLELAKSKLAELERNERAIAEDRRRGKMAFGEALDEYIQGRRRDATLKPRTKDYDEQQVVALLKTWPGLHRRWRWADTESIEHMILGTIRNGNPYVRTESTRLHRRNEYVEADISIT